MTDTSFTHNTLNRRDFAFLLSLGLAKAAFGTADRSSSLDKHYLTYEKKYGVTNPDVSLPKKTFRFEEKTITLNTERFCLVNYDLSAEKERFYILDADSNIELSSRASHGVNTGNHTSRLFSNTEDSYQSSLGIFITGTHYVGHFGPSINLHGVSASNSKAHSRRIILHGAHYCSQAHIDTYGFLGRSLGCIALPKSKMISAYQSLKPGTILIAKMDVRKKMTESLIPPTSDETIENRIS